MSLHQYLVDRRLRSLLRLVVLIALALVVAGCQTVYYSVWESLGREKRDLLRSNVEDVQKDQEEVGEQFEDTLERIRALYGVDADKLEKHYDKAKSEYESSVARADALRERIDAVRTIGEDLFEEWEEELGEISDASLRRRSAESLRVTRQRFNDLETALARTEAALDPPLQKFKDQVLFLKHNLNAQAVGSLRAETVSIEEDVDELLGSLRASIRSAERFIADLPE
ncbi:MAG: DUF2959 family protein [Acidobacteriota bacterium]